MRFHRTSPRRPPYLNRRDQMRMLRLVGLLLLVLLAVRFAARPATWAWMFPDQAATDPDDDRADEPPEARRPVEHRVRFDDDEQPLRPGEFRSRPMEERSDRPAKNRSVESDDAEGGHPAAEEDLDLDPGLLAPVRDDFIGVPQREAEPYYAILAKLGRLAARRIDAAGNPDVTYTVLMNLSEDYRGELIAVEGSLKRLVPLPDEENRHDVTGLWDAWVITPEAPTDPYRIVCTEIPEGIPQGEAISDEIRVRVTGYFFKRQGYASQGGFHTAPLLLAKTMRWQPPPPKPKMENEAAPYVLGTVLFVMAALCVTLWRVSRSDRRFEKNQLERMTAAPSEAIAALDELEADDPAEIFRRLSEEETASEEGESTS